VSTTAQSLEAGSTEQAASLEETSASGEEINAMARRNTETRVRERPLRVWLRRRSGWG